MASLPNCPNLVQLLGYIENPIAYVMKRYQYSLKDLYMNEPLVSSLMIVLKIAKDISNGMRVLHSHGIIHLDLKPRKSEELFKNIVVRKLNPLSIENILIDFDSESNQIVASVADFGSANVIGNPLQMTVAGLQLPTQNVLTYRYASPEVWVFVI